VKVIFESFEERWRADLSMEDSGFPAALPILNYKFSRI
jgi:hypothetical protein